MLRLSLLAIGMLFLQPASARKDDRDQPVNVVHAHSMDGYNAPNSISTYQVDVLVTQGTIKLTGELVKIFTAKDDTSVDHVITTGTPAKRPHIEQIDDDGNLMTGDADQIYYDNVNSIAILTGNAHVHQATKGDAHGQKLTYNVQTNYMTGESAPGGLVSMTFLPKPKPGKPGQPTPAKPAAATPVPTTAKPASSPSSSAAPVTIPVSASSSPTKEQP